MEGWWADDLIAFSATSTCLSAPMTSEFCSHGGGKNPIRTVVSASPWSVGGRTVGFEIVGHSFLWNQVRRIAMAVHSMELGRLSEDEVRDALERPEVPVDFGVAPAEWLILGTSSGTPCLLLRAQSGR